MNEIPKEESTHTEFKESLADSAGIVETIVAFSNASGGTLFIGINEQGRIRGIQVGKKTIEQLTNTIAQQTTPRLYPKIEKLDIEEKTIMLIAVEAGHEKPYLARGAGYTRVGKSNVKMDLAELEYLILKKHTEKTRFDNLVSEATFADIDESEVTAFVKEANIRRKQVFVTDDTKNVMQNLNFIKGEKILNGGVLCFGTDPQRFFPQCAFRCAVFKNGAIVNHQLIEGPLFKMIEEVQKFATFNIQRSYVIKGARREDVFEYPLEAVREAIINASVHRDYFSNSSCYLSIEEDRIEIKNPGVLPEELPLEQLKEAKHASIPRNKLIARVAFLNGYIEQWGTGTTNMINQCRRAGLHDPIFEERHGFFVVSLLKKRFEISKRQQKALTYFQNNITAKTYATYLKISTRTAIGDINKLIQYGLLIKEGTGRNTTYRKR